MFLKLRMLIVKNLESTEKYRRRKEKHLQFQHKGLVLCQLEGLWKVLEDSSSGCPGHCDLHSYTQAAAQSQSCEKEQAPIWSQLYSCPCLPVGQLPTWAGELNHLVVWKDGGHYYVTRMCSREVLQVLSCLLYTPGSLDLVEDKGGHGALVRRNSTNSWWISRGYLILLLLTLLASYQWASGERRGEILSCEFFVVVVSDCSKFPRGRFQNCVWSVGFLCLLCIKALPFAITCNNWAGLHFFLARKGSSLSKSGF